MHKKNYPVANIGSASLLVIFIILSLVTFGVLSLSGANRDYQYNRRIADRTTAYYEACNQAERKLQKIASLLDTYASDSEALTANLELLEVSRSTSHTLQYCVPIDDTQQLLVELALSSVKDDPGCTYTVTCWKAVRTEEWNGDTTLNLM